MYNWDLGVSTVQFGCPQFFFNIHIFFVMIY